MVVAVRINRQHPTRLAVLAVLIALLASVSLLLPRLAARAVPPTPGPVTGNATWFEGLGSPYGGCGLPQAALDTQDFVALNVYNTPGDYAFYPRPIPASLADKIGLFDNGRNCGRYVQVTVSDNCTGINDGAPNQPFCRNGSFIADAYNGATLTMVVADSCGDANAWCRDDPYHLDLAKASLNRFVKNGTAVGDLYPDHWNNRHLTWQFVPAPNYTGDIKIGFLQGAQTWWGAIAISHLPNGIHGVEYLAGGTWQQAQMNSDMGESYILAPTTPGGVEFKIRVRDASDALINNGRIYSFTLPSSCSPQCATAYTEVAYATSTTPTPNPTQSDIVPTPSPTSTPTSVPGAACRVTYAVNDWGSGFTGTVTIANTGTTAVNGWTLRFAFPGNQQLGQGWSATWGQAGANVTAANASFNGTIAPGASTQIGFNGTYSGSNPRPAAFTLNNATCATA
jgi:expansin (peptidoglycan-binding protein)